MSYELDGMRLNQIGQKAEGLAQEQKALANDPNNPEIHVLVGRRMLKDGQAEAGLKEIQKAISLDDKRATFYVELARAQMAMPNGSKDAIASLQKALGTLPGSAKLLSLLGDAYQKSGDAKNAQVQYEKAINLDPKAAMPDARLALGEMARKELRDRLSYHLKSRLTYTPLGHFCRASQMGSPTFTPYFFIE